MNKIIYIVCSLFVCFLGLKILIDEYDYANADEIVIRDNQGVVFDIDFLEEIKNKFPNIMTKDFVYALGIHVAKYSEKFDVEEIRSEIPDDLQEYFVSGYNEIVTKKQEKNKRKR
ncbi:MAG: hypothetical protein IJR49_06340 [Treponema sp.]|nr:hypothetical protein [Treponema sp.]